MDVYVVGKGVLVVELCVLFGYVVVFVVYGYVEFD